MNSPIYHITSIQNQDSIDDRGLINPLYEDSISTNDPLSEGIYFTTDYLRELKENHENYTFPVIVYALDFTNSEAIPDLSTSMDENPYGDLPEDIDKSSKQWVESPSTFTYFLEDISPEFLTKVVEIDFDGITFHKRYYN